MLVEVLQAPWLKGNLNADKLVAAAVIGLRAAGYQVRRAMEPAWGSERIVIWGLGHPRAQALLLEAKARGVTVIGFDLGYWHRGDRYRVSVNDTHPQATVMRKQRPLSRLLADGISLREDADPNGPVILVGIGQKSAATYGEEPGAWEALALSKIRRAWPDRSVIFRPKQGGGAHDPPGVDDTIEGGTIEHVLQRSAAVYCRHSNVAVDAIIAGVPAIAEDGAAAAVCEMWPVTGRLPSPLSRETRKQFLANLAWFQWSFAELRGIQAWAVIEDIVRSA